MTKKIGLFFGAGAEIAYGMPDGGRFALDVFRAQQTKAKVNFRNALKQVDKEASHYVTEFLPKDFNKKNVTVFGKAQLATIFRSSLKTHRVELKNQLDNFDEQVAQRVLSERDLQTVKNILQRLAGIDDIDDFTLAESVSLTSGLKSDENNRGVFSSNILSACLKAVSQKSTTSNNDGDDAELTQDKACRKDLGSFIQAILELYIGAVGESTVERLNNHLFEVDDGLDEQAKGIVESFDGIFRLDYSQLGMSALGYVIDAQEGEESEQDNDRQQLQHFIFASLRQLIASCINYQELIDSHWRFLYSPKEEWGKFTKIAIFLEGVRLYVEEKRKEARIDSDASNANYYHDLKHVQENAGSLVVGTSNYTDLIEEISGLKQHVYYLNGKVTERYDPYTNEMFEVPKASEKRLTVPLLFTQSGIKPLTSIEMAKRYVRLYEHYERCEQIAIVGFGFNGDDGHINGMFRQLHEQSKALKKLTIFHYDPTFSMSETELQKLYKNKLRLATKKHLEVLSVDNLGRLDNGKLWYTALT